MEAPLIAARAHASFTVTTRWSDEDRQGVLNNAACLTLCEEARHRWCVERGLLLQNDFPFVLAQANTRWLAPGAGGEEVVVELATLEVGTTSFTQSYRIVHKASGVVWAECEARLVAWDAATRGKTALPARLRAALEADLGRG
jgi:acyl-CoA thioesterase FadM